MWAIIFNTIICTVPVICIVNTLLLDIDVYNDELSYQSCGLKIIE